MSASEPETEIKKRLYVGGLSQGVTEDELKQRFELFVKVPSIHVKFQADGEGNHVKTFAHMDVQGTESGLKKLYNAYQNAKWRGSVVKLEDAKESFLDRLSVERQDEKKKQMDLEKSKKRKVEEWKNPDLDKLKVVPVPGTPVPGKKDWVVGKYGRVLPVLNVKKSYVTKAVKHDPSKFCHASKVFKDDDGGVPRVNCDKLTWEIDQPDSEITKKRKGEFPVDARPKKTLKVLPVEVSKSSPVKDKSSNKSSPKEKSSNKSSPKEKSSNKSSPKEHFSDKTFPKENSAKSRDIHIDPSSGQDDDGRGAVTEDGLEIVKVGGKYQSQKKCAVRSRFDSDYESDSGDNTEQSIKVNNENNNNNNNVKAKHVKSPKKTNISTDPCDKEDEREGEKAIPEFKGIGSLVASPGKKNTKQNKTLPNHTKNTVCNGVMSSDTDKKEAETNSKNKRNKEPPLSDLQKSSLIQVKKPGDEKNSLSAMQQNASQYADLLLSEFVAKAPQNRLQSRQKYDPYDSDLDSDNFELVAKKLAKRAGIEAGVDKGRKKNKQPVNHDNDKEYNMNNGTNGEKNSTSLTNLMFSLAGGYTPVRKATAAVAESNNTDSSASKKTIRNMNGNNVEESKDKKRVEDSNDEEEEDSSDEEEDNSNKIVKKMKTVSGGENKQNVKDSSHEKDDNSDDDVKNKKRIDIRKAKKKNEDSDDDDSSDEEDESSDEAVQNVKKAGGEEAKKKIQESSSEGDSDSSDEEEEEDGSEKCVKDNRGAGGDDEEEEESSEEDGICDKVEKNEKSVNGKTQEVEDGSSDEDDDDEEEESSSDEEEGSDKKVEKMKKKVDERKDKKSTEDDSSDETEESSDDEEEDKIEKMKKKVDDKKDKEKTKDSSSSSDEEDDSSDEEDSCEKVQIKKKKTDSREDGKKTVDDNSDEEDESSDDDESDGSEKILTGSVKPVPAGDAKVTTGIKRKAGRSSSSSSSSSDEEEEEEEVKDDNGEGEDISLAEEKLKNLKVLENVVGKDKVDKLTAKLKKNNVFIMDMNQLRFDPTKLQPSPIGQKDTTTKKTKTSFDISFKKEVHIKTEPLTPREVSSKDTNLKRDKKQEKERDMNQERFDPPKLISPKTEPKTEKTKSPLNVSVKREVEESESDISTHEESEEEPPEDKTRKRAKKQKKERDMDQQESDSPTTPAPSKEVTAKQKKKNEKKKKDISVKKEAEDGEGETQDSTQDVPLNDKTLKQDKELKKGRVVESATRSAVTVSDLFMNALKSRAHSGQTDQGRDKSVGQASASSFSLLDMFDGDEPMDTDSLPAVKPLSALPDPSKLRGSGSLNGSTGSNKTVEEENENRTIKVIEEIIPKFKVKPQGSKDVPITTVTTTDTASKETQKKELKKLKAAHDKVLKDAGRVDVRFSKDDWTAKNVQIRQNILKICKNRNSFAVRKKKNEEVREKGKAVRRFGSWEK